MNPPDYMHRALRLAARGRTSPNPMVGAVVVADGRIVGEGFHPKAGQPHAEVYALSAAAEKARGADLYVTLEPCCHEGRTPPCTSVIISSGIARVFASIEDPDPRVNCRGLDRLRAAGIAVEVGLCGAEAAALNAAYIKHRTVGLPLVILKSAMSLDGRIASRTGDSKWITGERARVAAHRLRSRVDAIVVGAATARADDPALTARTGRVTRYPKRVVVTSSGRLSPKLAMLGPPGESIVATCGSADPRALAKLQAAGARVLLVAERDGRPSIADLMRHLAQMDCLSVLIEGGGELAASALEERIVDRVMLFYAPRIIGGRRSVPAIGGTGAETVAGSISIQDVHWRRYGGDLAIEGRVVYPE